MKITYDWLKDHLKISAKEDKLLEKLTDIGLEVESIENLSEGLDLFKVAKILKTEKHPNADRLKVCDVDVGNKEIKKVVCGAANAREGLITVYAPPGAIIPKNKTGKKFANPEKKFEVCFTGFPKAEKEQLIKMAEQHEMFVRTRVTSKLGLLVCGDNAGWAKIKEAAELDVPSVFGLAGFENFINTGEMSE